MNTSLTVGLLLGTACSIFLGAATSAQTPPVLPGVGQAMKAEIEKHEIAGAVTLVADEQDIVHLEATGLADVERREPMKPDTIFWIASMTKPIAASAILALRDDGKLSIEDPVGKYIPELADLKTPTGKPANLTLRHLLTHTSGMAEASNEQSRAAQTLADLIPAYVKPVQFEPGTKWQYCQSGINTLGRIVEVVSGKPFQEFVDERFFKPLGMKDTTFYLSPEQAKRLATSYKVEDGKLTPSQIFILEGHAPVSRNRYPAANGGLFSTAPDYARFARMILNNGSLDGRQYLKPESVKLMTTLQTDDLQTGFTPGNGWGLGWCVVKNPQGPSSALSEGSFGHGGAYGTQAWIDPVKKRVFLLMVQRANFPNADASITRQAFQNAAVAAMK